MISEIVTALVGVVSAAISAIVSFLLTKRKYSSEVESQEIANIRESFQLYKETMKETLEIQDRKIDELMKENGELKGELKALREQITRMVTDKLKSYDNNNR